MLRNKGMFGRFIIFSSIFGMLFVSSCSKEEDDDDCPVVTKDTLIINFNAYTDGDSMEYKKEFRDPMGRIMRVEKFIHYISDVYLLQGNKSKLVKDVALIIYERNGDADVTDELQQIKVAVPVGSYDGIKLTLGLNDAQNGSDPISYPIDHPLSAEQNMYWSQWLMYRFAMLDGRVDTDNDDLVDLTFSHHPGSNNSDMEKTFTRNFEVKEGENNELNFSIEFTDIYFGEQDTLDMAVIPAWHGDTATEYVSINLMTNMANTLTLE